MRIAMVSIGLSAAFVSFPAAADLPTAAPAPASELPPPTADTSGAQRGDRSDVTGATAGSKSDWRFSWNGYFRAPLRIGVGSRSPCPAGVSPATKAGTDLGNFKTALGNAYEGSTYNSVYCAAPGQSTTTLHSPYIPDDQYLAWNYTRQWEQAWAEVFLSYGNDKVKGTVGIQGYDFTDASHARQPGRARAVRHWAGLDHDYAGHPARRRQSELEGGSILGEVRYGRPVRRRPLRHVHVRSNPPDGGGPDRVVQDWGLDVQTRTRIRSPPRDGACGNSSGWLADISQLSELQQQQQQLLPSRGVTWIHTAQSPPRGNRLQEEPRIQRPRPDGVEPGRPGRGHVGLIAVYGRSGEHSRLVRPARRAPQRCRGRGAAVGRLSRGSLFRLLARRREECHDRGPCHRGPALPRWRRTQRGQRHLRELLQRGGQRHGSDRRSCSSITTGASTSVLSTSSTDCSGCTRWFTARTPRA